MRKIILTVAAIACVGLVAVPTANAKDKPGYSANAKAGVGKPFDMATCMSNVQQRPELTAHRASIICGKKQIARGLR